MVETQNNDKSVGTQRLSASSKHSDVEKKQESYNVPSACSKHFVILSNDSETISLSQLESTTEVTAGTLNRPSDSIDSTELRVSPLSSLIFPFLFLVIYIHSDKISPIFVDGIPRRSIRRTRSAESTENLQFRPWPNYPGRIEIGEMSSTWRRRRRRFYGRVHVTFEAGAIVSLIPGQNHPRSTVSTF